MSDTPTTKRAGRPKKMENLTQEELVAQAKEELGLIVKAEAAPLDHYKKLADLLIHLRMKFTSPKRDFPDWAGRSMDYRNAAAAIYAEASIPPDSQDGIQARIRYHVSNRLREVAPTEQLAALGMRTEGANARQQAPKSAAAEKWSPGRIEIHNRGDVYKAARDAIERMVFELPVPEADSDEYVDTMVNLMDLTMLCAELLAAHERRRGPVRNRMQLLQTFQLAFDRSHDGDVNHPAEIMPSADALRELRSRVGEEVRILSAGARRPELVEAAA